MAYNEAQLYEAVQATLASVVFTPPMSISFTGVVKVELAKRLPGAVLDVYFTPTRFIVEARSDAKVYKLELQTG